VKYLFFITAFLTVSCAAPGVTLSPAQLSAPSAALAPLDTLAAYRKAPGQPKTEYVAGHWRHTMHGTDSVYVNPYYRSAAN